MDQHRFQSMDLLTGTLRLRSSLALLWNDELVYNGGVYSNWGYGVPVLQAPFHAIGARWSQLKFFPDRAIYFTYFMVTIAVLWSGLQSLITMRDPSAPPLKRHFLSWAATWLVVACSLYPLMSCRFIIYEETISYLVLCELFAVGCYLRAIRSWSVVPVCGMGVASGLGLLVRPTGIFYLGAWAAFMGLESRSRRAIVAFAASAAPFVSFWLYTNWVKSGSPLGLGLSNQVVRNLAQATVMRFGNHCVDSYPHALGVARLLFRALFVAVPEIVQPWLHACNFFGFEERPPAVHEAFFGLTVFAILSWIALSYVVHRERRPAFYVPFIGLAAIFGIYLYAGAGFAWRYAGDLWPFIVLACAQYVRSLPISATSRLGVPLAGVLAISAVCSYKASLEPWPPGGYYGERWETLSPVEEASLWERFAKSRWTPNPPLPSRIRCGDRFDWPPANMEGWSPGCAVDIATNLFMGVPRRPAGEAYQLRLETEGVSANTLRVFVNGRIYTARREGATYTARLDIRYSRLASPIVLAAVEWPTGIAGSAKLLAIEIA